MFFVLFLKWNESLVLVNMHNFELDPIKKKRN